MAFIRTRLPIIVTFVAGVIIIAAYYFNLPAWAELTKELVRWNIILAAFALALGLASMIRLHLGRIQRGSKDAVYSAVMLATLAGFIGVGLAQTTGGATYSWLWDHVLLPVQATSYATTFFFITSAAYRAFRIKNAQAAVLLGAALLVMGRVGLGAVLIPQLQPISAWIMDIPNTAGMRAVTIGGALALVGNAFRIVVGLERGHLGGGQ